MGLEYNPNDNRSPGAWLVANIQNNEKHLRKTGINTKRKISPEMIQFLLERDAG